MLFLERIIIISNHIQQNTKYLYFLRSVLKTTWKASVYKNQYEKLELWVIVQSWKKYT